MKNYCLHHSFCVKDKNRLKTKCFCEFCEWNHRQDVADYFKDNINRPRHEVFKECLERFGGK